MFVCFPIPFCWALVSHLFVFACLSLFRNFTFLIYSNLFLNICLFLFSFLNVSPSVAPILRISFLRLCLVWSSFFSPFLFSPVTYFFTQRHVFVLFPFVQSLFFFKKKTCVSCLLALSKVSTCPLCFLLLFSLFNLLLLNASFFFQNKNSVGKTSCVLVYRSLFSFSFICFSCRFLVVFFLIPFATCFLSKNDLCNSLFPPFVHPLSICSLSLPLLNFFFFALYYLHVSLRQTLCATKKLFFWLLQKNICFLCWASWKINLFFLCLVFSVSWKMISHFVYLSSFFCFIFWTLFLFFTLFFSKYRKNRCSCWKMEQKLYLVFCFCFLGSKTCCVRKNPFYFSTIFDLLFEFFSLFT